MLEYEIFTRTKIFAITVALTPSARQFSVVEPSIDACGILGIQ